MIRRRFLLVAISCLMCLQGQALSQEIALPPPNPGVLPSVPPDIGLEANSLPADLAEGFDGSFRTIDDQAMAIDGAQEPGGGRYTGLESHSLPSELAEDFGDVPSGGRRGPTPVADVRILMDILRWDDVFSGSNSRVFGWWESGYTGSSSGSGMMSIEPTQNRFGNGFMMNQLGIALQKPLEQDRFNLGYHVRYFAGADAALGQPKGGIGSTIADPYFSQDFRDLYLSAHFPILTERGLDFKIGRMNTIIGYNGFLAPYRPFYSSDYQFFYAQDGAFTGFLGNLHVTDRLEVWSGMSLGANTFFTLRSDNSYCYIGQANYWLTDERRTRLTGSVYAGPDAIFAAPGMNGDFVTMVELRIQQNWTDRFTQIVQSNMGWDRNTPVGTGAFYGVYTIGIFHVAENIDAQFRAEWFDDSQGTRTGIDTNYAEVTLGLNWYPTKFLEIRPEIRGDFAGKPAFGVGGRNDHFSQLTGGISAMLKF